MKGKFIAIDGIEGAGKSTQIKFITQYFKERGYDVVCTREPGGTDFGERLRSILLDANESIMPISELLLLFASRYQHLHEKILPALKSGNIIVSDRWVDSSYAYQGGGRGIDMNTIKLLQNITLKEFTPDLTLFLNLPLDIALKRVNNRKTNDRFEQESNDFFIKTYNVYQQLLAHNNHIHNIDTSHNIMSTKNTITKLLDTLI